MKKVKATTLFHEAFFLCILILFTLTLFGQILITGKSLFGKDIVSQFYPWKLFLFEHVRSHGSIPFWNPYIFSGTPFIANMQASMFYPLGFLYYLIPPDDAYTYSTMLHIVMGSIFMYAFMRSLKVSQTGGFISAFVFSFNGYFIGHLFAGHLSFIQNYIWIPLIMLYLYRFTRIGHLKYAVITGVFLGIQILGGFPQIAFYTILGILAFCTFHGTALLKDRSYREATRLGLGVAIIVGVGFSLAAIQLLPTLEFTRYSTRTGGVSYAFATYDSLNPKEMLAFLIPDVFGNPVDWSYWRSAEFWHFWESCGYVGILPLLLVFVKSRENEHKKMKLFFILLIVISLFLSLGKHNPIYPLIYNLPGFDRFRIPAQILFLYVFGLSVLAGMGVHSLEKEGRPHRVFWGFVFVAGGILLSFVVVRVFFPFQFFFQLFKNLAEGPVTHANMDVLYSRISSSIDRSALLFFCSMLMILSKRQGWLKARAFKIALSVTLVFDLYLFDAQFIRPHEYTRPADKEEISNLMTKTPDHGRVLTKSNLFLPNDGLLYGFPSISGYDPLIPRRYVYYIQSSQNQKQDDHVVHLTGINNFDAKLLKMLNFKHLVLDNHVWQIENSVGYLNVVGKAVIKPYEEVLGFMNSDKFDSKKMVVLERPDDSLPPIGGNTLSASGYVDAYEDDSIRLRVSTNKPAYLVLSEIFYPGWQATVDSISVPVIRGNYLFCVILLNKGEHEVHIRFISWPFRIGFFVSLVTLFASIWFILRKDKGRP